MIFVLFLFFTERTLNVNKSRTSPGAEWVRIQGKMFEVIKIIIDLYRQR